MPGIDEYLEKQRQRLQSFGNFVGGINRPAPKPMGQESRSSGGAGRSGRGRPSSAQGPVQATRRSNAMGAAAKRRAGLVKKLRPLPTRRKFGPY